MQFDRVIRAKILLANETYTAYTREIDITNLRMSFNVLKTSATDANTGDLIIYNLSAEKRNLITGFGDQLRIFAGYRNSGGAELLFIGSANQLNHTFNQPDITTQLNCGDGETTLNNTNIAISFAANTNVRTVIEFIAKQLRFPIAYFAPTPPGQEEVYTNGFSEIYLARTILESACKKIGMQFSIQNDNMIIIPINGTTEKPPVVINVQNGMIGVPERYVDKRYYQYNALIPNEPPKPGYRIKMLLRPDILPGDKIRIQSRQIDIDQQMIVYNIRHTGDNYESNFESIIEAFPI